MSVAQTAAQSGVLNPTTVTFRPSSDHDAMLPDGRAVVERYDLEIWAPGAGLPESQISLGKPAIDTATGEVMVTPPGLVGVPVGRQFVVTVSAVGASGIGRSDPPVPFVRRGPPAPPTGVTLR